jgi:hypothetical protein
MPTLRPLALAALLASAAACAPDGSPEATEARVRPVGAELMTQQAPRQQAPQQAPRDFLTGGFYCPPTDYYDDYAEVRATAGKYPFYWTRAWYSGGGYRGSGSWSVDFPKSDQQFLIVIERLVRLNAHDCENPVMLADPDLRKFPLIYMLEVGGMYLTEAEVVGLRGYMDAGGFVIVDDFWGQREWDQFIFNLRRVFPERSLVPIGLDHPVYSAFYDIDEVVQVPAVGRVYQPKECPYGDPCIPTVMGMYDDDDRLMMMVNFNTDLGDAWEWAERPDYPLELSTYAYQMGANMIVYAMSH